MGFKCDMCGVEDAAIFCFADQAVMCSACDSRVHSANKVAKRHERVELRKETEAPVCDICQEHKAIMFCAEDRALICRRCDLMIHTANEFVAKHHRHLLSGVTVGLKALEGLVDDSDEGKSKKPYSLRNTGASSSKGKDSWKSSTERNIWNKEEETAPAAKPGLGNVAVQGSQPSLIDTSARPDLPAATPLGVTTEAALLPTFDGAEPSSRLGSNDSGASGSHAGPGAGSSQPFSDWPEGMDPLRPAGSDFTLAAELLGIPNVSTGFTAKDIDAAYIFDDELDMDADLSALLEVPDLEAFQPGNPVVVNSQSQAPVPGSLGEKRTASVASAGADGVVPDMPQTELNDLKRQRV